MVEVMDHRPGTMVNMTFDNTYSEVALEADQVSIQHNGNTLTRSIKPSNRVEISSLANVDTICLANNGDALSLTAECEMPEEEG